MIFSPEIPLAQLTHRAVVMRIEDFLIIFMFFTWLVKTTINKELGLIRHTPINLPMMAYILVCIISTGLAISAGYVSLAGSFFYVLKYVEYFMLFFMVSNNIRSKEQVKKFIVILLITCLFTCIYALLTPHRFITGRASAPFEGRAGEPNTLSGYLVLLFPIAAGFFLYSSSRIWRFFCLALACLIFITLVETLSRSSYVAFIILYLTITFFSRRKKLLLIGILIFGIFILPVMLPRTVINRVTSTFIPGTVYRPFGQEIALESSPASRIERWKIIINKLVERPILGYGVTGVGLVDSQYALVLGEVGIIGFLIFIWLIIMIISCALRNLHNIEDDFAQGLSLGFFAGFIGLLIHSFGANTFIIIRIMEPFWFIAAVAMSLPRLFIPLEQTKIQPESRLRQSY